MFRFTIRDVLWMTAVAALAIGWWIDRDHIRRERESLKEARQAFVDELENLQALQVKRVEAMLRVVEAELASMNEIRQKNANAISENEMRAQEARVEVARLAVEMATAKDRAEAKASRPPPAAR